MPNRTELAPPKRRPSTMAVARTGDAWPVVGFCALGFLTSVFVAVSSIGLDAVRHILG
jgi:hypothetical protein